MLAHGRRRRDRYDERSSARRRRDAEPVGGRLALPAGDGLAHSGNVGGEARGRPRARTGAKHDAHGGERAAEGGLDVSRQRPAVPAEQAETGETGDEAGLPRAVSQPERVRDVPRARAAVDGRERAGQLPARDGCQNASGRRRAAWPGRRRSGVHPSAPTRSGPRRRVGRGGAGRPRAPSHARGGGRGPGPTKRHEAAGGAGEGEDRAAPRSRGGPPSACPRSETTSQDRPARRRDRASPRRTSTAAGPACVRTRACRDGRGDATTARKAGRYRGGRPAHRDGERDEDSGDQGPEPRHARTLPRASATSFPRRRRR